MKTMNRATSKGLHSCLKIRQSFCLLLVLMAFSASAADKHTILRKPAAIDEEVLTVPLSADSFSNENIFAEDDAGIMRGMKESINSWEKTEEYAQVWDLKSTGLYNTPSTSEKGQFISKKLLRYADKRLSGEMKKADEGSALHKMSRVEKQLRPSAAISVSKNFGLKFKARVLQGKAIVEVKNPWVDCNATVGANGKTKVLAKKEFKQLGLSSGAEYAINEEQFVAFVDQQVTNNVKARLSSTQSNGTNVFRNDADARVEMTASFPFNL